jgi:hypothetical protein
MELTEREKLDNEMYNKFFEEKTHYPVADPEYFKKKKQDSNVKRYIAKEGILPALASEIWDHDTDLKSIENVIKYCYENKFYGKTLGKAISMITSKKVMYKRDGFGDTEDGREKEQSKDEISLWAITHTISHFVEGIYETGRYDLAKKLNEYTVRSSISLKDLRTGGSDDAYVSAMIKAIQTTGKNLIHFKDSGFDNREFLHSSQNREHSEYGRLMKIKHFDETGELLPQEEIQEPEEITEGVYVDVDDTLVIGENQLNQEVVNKLKEYKDQGKNITIFTGGEYWVQKERLQKLGLEKEIGEFEVVSKEDFQNKKLEITIDDFSQDQLKNIFRIFSQDHTQV